LDFYVSPLNVSNIDQEDKYKTIFLVLHVYYTSSKVMHHGDIEPPEELAEEGSRND